MKAKFSLFVQHALTRVYAKDKKLAEKIQRQIELFESNPSHPSLRLHKLSGSMKNTWSISINVHIRLLYVMYEEDAYFFDIGTHDEVYKR